MLTLITLMFYDFYMLGTFYFYVLGIFLLYDIARNKKIKLIHVWCFAFVFIILSEVFLTIGETLDANLLAALKFLIIANNVILMGYFSNESITSEDTNNHYTYTPRKVGGIFLIILVLIYFLFNLPSALIAFSSGRQAGSEGQDYVLSSIISSAGFVLPSVILFYFHYLKKTQLLVPLLFSLPIFAILFMGGTRFPLLFSFLGFFITYQNLNEGKISVKKLALMVSAGIILVSASFAMKEFRSNSGQDAVYAEEKAAYKDIPTYTSQYFSNEGVIDMTGLMMQHFTFNNHLYGTSSSFVAYFWVPRFLWEDKPTMLGHWFIRLYRGGFSDGHSASFGFTGDLFADFGYGSLFFIFFLGRLIRRGEIFQAKALASKNYKVILGAMLYPYVFFFVRSPITATITFLGILFFFYIFKRIIFAEQLEIKSI